MSLYHFQRKLYRNPTNHHPTTPSFFIIFTATTSYFTLLSNQPNSHHRNLTIYHFSSFRRNLKPQRFPLPFPLFFGWSHLKRRLESPDLRQPQTHHQKLPKTDPTPPSEQKRKRSQSPPFFIYDFIYFAAILASYKLQIRWVRSSGESIGWWNRRATSFKLTTTTISPK